MELNHLKNPIKSNDNGTVTVYVYKPNHSGVMGCLINVKDLHKICNKTWYLVNGYAKAKHEGKSVCMSKFIYNVFDSVIDHKNNNPLDNRYENLRMVTPRQNSMNSKPAKNRSSKYKGVSLCKNTNKWVVRIRNRNESKYENLGRFYCEEEAAKTYNKRARELFGEYAWLNPV